MKPSNNQKISISLPPELIRYSDEYQREHQLSSRSEVLVEALKALRKLELIESYKQAADDRRRNPDPWLDSDINEGLEPSDEDNW